MTVNFSKHCIWILSKVSFSGSFNRLSVRSGNEIVARQTKFWTKILNNGIHWYFFCERFLYQNLSTVPEVQGVQTYGFQ